MMSSESSLATTPSPSGNRRSKFFLPLSNHGMPKTPISPEGSIRPHRFSTIGSPFSDSVASPLMSPMSPPMSAKSFGTFIDSEPSTPAYSPRMGNGWDSSTLMLLSPVSSAPSSPVEPEWEMMTPMQKRKSVLAKSKATSSLAREISSGTSLSSHPVKHVVEEEHKENTPPAGSEPDPDDERKYAEEQGSQPAPVGRFARMKSILRRKTVSERRSDRRRRNYQELDRMEDVHWTEY